MTSMLLPGTATLDQNLEAAESDTCTSYWSATGLQVESTCTRRTLER